MELIHHSDKGTQYCSNEYVKLLLNNNIGISITETSEPLENAIPERIHGIIKKENSNDYQLDNLDRGNKWIIRCCYSIVQ